MSNSSYESGPDDDLPPGRVENGSADGTGAPVPVAPPVGLTGGTIAPTAGAGTVGSAGDEAGEGDAERAAFESGEDELGASGGPAGGNVRP